MIQVDRDFLDAMEQRRDFMARAEVTLADGTELSFGPDDFVIGGTSVTDGAGVTGIPLGEAICRTAQLELNNTDGRLDQYDFYRAQVRLWLRFAVGERTAELSLGRFIVTEPETGGETVTISAGDVMTQADKPYTGEAGRVVTLQTLWEEVCSQCDIQTGNTLLRNYELTVTVPGEECTCRQMLGYIAMVAGGNARISGQGEAEVLYYDRPEQPGEPYTLQDWSSLSVDTDSVTVTGLRTSNGDVSILEGEEGYVLQVDNPLIAGREAAYLKKMSEALVGLTVRRFDGQHVSYPLAEFMDEVDVRDRKGRHYATVLTDVTFTFGGYTELANSAEDAVRNASHYTSQAKEARQMVQQEKAEREKAIENEQAARGEMAKNLQKRLDEAGGLYCTTQRQPDGSDIYYLHDKPTLAESKVVMKLTAEVIGFSTDGGATYPYGFSVTGEMVMGIIETEGLSADWVKAGTFDLNLLRMLGTACGLMQGTGRNKDGETTVGIIAFGNGRNSDGSAKPPFLIITPSGIRAQDTENTCAYLSGGAMTLECAFRPYTGKAWKYLDWVNVTGTDGNTYQALCGFNSPH